MKHKYISVMDYGSSQGCFLRLPKIKYRKYVCYKGPTHYIPLSGCQSMAACLKAAIKYRDEYLTKHKSMYLIKGRQTNNPRRTPIKHSRRNTTGIIGVTMSTCCKISGDYSSYVAMWSSPPGEDVRQHRKSYSINIHGEKEAFLMACRLRYKHCGVLIIANKKAIPCLPDAPYEFEDK